MLYFLTPTLHNTNLEASISIAVNEREKKRLFSRRILEVKYASFILRKFVIYGAMSVECRTFVSRLKELAAIKRDLPNSNLKKNPCNFRFSVNQAQKRFLKNAFKSDYC